MLEDLAADPAAYGTLFFSAFTSATLLPGSSEAALVAMLAMGRGDPALLIATATAGNVLGSLVNWLLGRSIATLRSRRWFPVDSMTFDRAAIWYGRYGVWSLLLSWVPIIGDPLTVVAGALRIGVLRFLVLVTIGKAARYIAVSGAFHWWSGS